MAHILVVETDRVFADNVREFLRHCGHSVDWCYDLQYALDCADGNCPDIVILDLLLCGRSGVEFLYEFRSYPDWQSIPVVIYSNITSRDLGRTTAGFRQLNVSAYHYKPTTSLKELSETIDFLLAKPATV